VLVAATAIALAGGQPALSADTDAEVPTKALQMLPYYNWTGAYVGGNMELREGQTHNTLFDPDPASSNNSFGSLYGGVQAGYNVLLPSRVLLGIEADISFPNFLDTDDLVSTRVTPQGVATERIDFVSTLRGRVGYAFDRWLVYGTGGFAWSQSRFVESTLAGDDKFRQLRSGWSLGGGTEVAIAPQWTARLEYVYDHFDPAAITFRTATRFESATEEHALRVGLNRRLDDGYGEARGGTSGTSSATDRDWNVHGQSTFVEQGYPSFRSPYQGPNSLQGTAQTSETVSATAFVGVRPFVGTEIYINPELMQGRGFDDVHGVAAFPNMEAQKATFPVLRFNVARLFVRQTIGLGGEQETVEDGPNQLAKKQDISRLTFTVGKFSVTDFFDGNSYAHDPREDFLNWNISCCGSYDWTMDKIGYTWGAFAELNQKQWALRAGYFLVPVISNDNRYDSHVPERGEYIAELELRYSLFSQPGKLRLMPWVNIANAGRYSEAVDLPVTSPNYPDIALTRRVRTNYGFVVNAEQAITNDLGIFSRASWNAGQTEIIGWTDCDESISLGAVLKGTSWGRANDRVGIAGVLEGLSPEARAYFAAGGLGILIGDGALNYRPEQALESYYSYSINKWATLTADYQFFRNPGYNADRGPVSIFGTRLHVEF